MLNWLELKWKLNLFVGAILTLIACSIAFFFEPEVSSFVMIPAIAFWTLGLSFRPRKRLSNKQNIENTI